MLSPDVNGHRPRSRLRGWGTALPGPSVVRWDHVTGAGWWGGRGSGMWHFHTRAFNCQSPLSLSWEDQKYSRKWSFHQPGSWNEESRVESQPIHLLWVRLNSPKGNGKQPKYPWMGKWINKIWYVHTREYFSGFKKNEIPVNATIWMKRKVLILCRVIQTQEDGRFHFYETPRWSNS